MLLSVPGRAEGRAVAGRGAGVSGQWVPQAELYFWGARASPCGLRRGGHAGPVVGVYLNGEPRGSFQLALRDRGGQVASHACPFSTRL